MFHQKRQEFLPGLLVVAISLSDAIGSLRAPITSN